MLHKNCVKKVLKNTREPWKKIQKIGLNNFSVNKFLKHRVNDISAKKCD